VVPFTVSTVTNPNSAKLFNALFTGAWLTPIGLQARFRNLSPASDFLFKISSISRSDLLA
jgi:hypothetical protein